MSKRELFMLGQIGDKATKMDVAKMKKTWNPVRTQSFLILQHIRHQYFHASVLDK